MSWHWWDDVDADHSIYTREWIAERKAAGEKLGAYYDARVFHVGLRGQYHWGDSWAVAMSVEPEDAETVKQLARIRYGIVD